MRIPCPFCGERDLSEFSYLGDAARQPDLGADLAEPLFKAVYLRDNPAGPHEELWQHLFGCRSWLIVTRNTVTHEILAATLAQQAMRG
ncbi:MAG TPA: sarcosine oxidase subunit delta [Steroidobacteraceae bacterium]